jgi:Fe-S-cluster containining protein
MSDDLDALARQVERGSLFTHTALGRAGARTRELEAFVYGLIDALVERDVVSLEDVERAVVNAANTLDAAGEPPEPAVVLRRDLEPADDVPVEVNCAERMPICHAVCCKLDFPLAAEEVEAGGLQWDLGRPYLIRHDADGMCVHNDRETGGCCVYEDRPSPCRRYSCAGDERIWKDFERMELNEDWLAANLAEPPPRLLHAMLVRREPAEPPR